MTAFFGIVFTAALVLALPAGTARAQGPSTPSDGNAHLLARQLFAQGRIAYDLGNYDEAITRFQSAYEHLQEPAFLFNIAQAYRLKNDCTRAMDGYRRFLRLSQHVETRAAAEAHLVELSRTCPSALPVAPSEPQTVLPAVTPNSATEVAKRPTPIALTTSPPKQSAPNAAVHAFSLAALGGGSAAGVIALGLTVWNVRRYNQWSTENDFLAQAPVGSNPSELIERQNANDDRLTSIERAEKVGWGLAIGAAVLLVTGVVLKLVEKEP